MFNHRQVIGDGPIYLNSENWKKKRPASDQGFSFEVGVGVFKVEKIENFDF
jgi:hypothetical protein